MFRNLFSPRTSNLSLEEALELVNKRLELARKEDDSAKALELSSDAKSLMKDAENIFASTEAKDPALSEGIANAYHEHGRLLDDLGYHGKAKQSHSKAKKWGYVHVVSRHTGSSQPLDKSDTIRRSLSPTAALSVAPSVAAAIFEGTSGIDIAQHTQRNQGLNSIPWPNNDIVQIQQKIFGQDFYFDNVVLPVAEYTLPEEGERITSTPQLAYCLSLLVPSLISKERLKEVDLRWSQARVSDPDEQERLRTIATDVIRAFFRDEFKMPDVVTEIVTLAAVLNKQDFWNLLQALVDSIERSILLQIHLLDGLAQLIRNASPGYLDADDLVKILQLLSNRLTGTHAQSSKHMYQLAVTVSRVLDGMVDIQVAGLGREMLHEPLGAYMNGLETHSDPPMVFEAVYAFQALQYVPDDESVLQRWLRHTGKVVKGISGVVTEVKALDINGFVHGLKDLQNGLDSIIAAMKIGYQAYKQGKEVYESGMSFYEALKEGLSFDQRSVWYPALRGLDNLIQEGRLNDFEILIRVAPCKRDPAFQWGVSQRLGEIASNEIWPDDVRLSALSFLVEICRDDAEWGYHASVKQWMLHIINSLGSSEGTISEEAKKQMKELEKNIDGKQTLIEKYEKYYTNSYSFVANHPPKASPLLDRVQTNLKVDVEISLRQLRHERLEDRGGYVYISPRAKATPRATDHFDLTAKVQEFLASDGKVFLLLGDSGAGKSTFNRALEISLWSNYKINGRIPLFINLPAIEKPERNLIEEVLCKANFTQSEIQVLKLHREFILICDGYDESQQTRNLYKTNQLNQPGRWRAQMVISCRTEYLGVDYKDRFLPIDRNGGGGAGEFQEAIISPFTREQIQDYIGQYVSSQKSPWGLEDYQQAHKQIPNLQDLVKNPFLLKLALEVLPRLLGSDGKYSAARVTRIELYDEFVAQWIERGKTRLAEMELSSCDKLAFNQLSDSGFRQRGITYLKELATAIYDNQGGNPVVDYSERQDRTTWKGAFFGKRDGSHLLRDAIPLTHNGDQYQFFDRSFLEYGLALAVFDPSKYDGDSEVMPSVSRRGSASSVISFESHSSTDRAATADDNSLLDSPLGRRSLVDNPSILKFLADRVQQYDPFKQQLLAVIERSKKDKIVQIAAANAITILVQAKVRFNGANLQGVKIPGADLSYGVFDSADLSGADLRKVNLQNTRLRHANLSEAKMTGALTGNLQYLQEDVSVECCAFSPDDTLLIVGLYDGTIKVYGTSRWTSRQSLTGHNRPINAVAFSKGGDQIASGSSDGTIRLWSISTGCCTHTLKGHASQVWSIVYSPMGDQIASGSNDRTVRLWDVETGNCTHILNGHSLGVNSVAYFPSGDQIISGSDDETVKLWSASTGDHIHTFEGHSSYVRSVTYSPSHNQIASGSRDMTVRLWDVSSGNCTHILEGHSLGVSCVVYAPSESQMASSSWDMTVRLWSVSTGDCTHILEGHCGFVSNVIYSLLGDQIASSGYDNTVRLWTIATVNFIHSVEGHRGSVNSVMYSLQGSQAISSSNDMTVRLWDVSTGNCVNTLEGHSHFVNCATYSPRGDMIATCSDDETVRLWDVSTGDCIKCLEGHHGRVNSVVYSPERSQIASSGDDETVKIWDISNDKCIHTLKGHRDAINSIVYSPRGDRIASGSKDKAVRLWDVLTGNCIHLLQGHSGFVNSVVYSPIGDQIASGSSDSTVRLWDVETGNSVHAFQGHCGNVYSVTYLPTGELVGSGGEDKTVRLWDVVTFQCLLVIKDYSGAIASLSLRETNHVLYMVTGGHDNSVQQWQIQKEDKYKATMDWTSSYDFKFDPINQKENNSETMLLHE